MLKMPSVLWPSVQQLKLTINERVRHLQGQDQQQQQAAFADTCCKLERGGSPRSQALARMLSGCKTACACHATAACQPWCSTCTAKCSSAQTQSSPRDAAFWPRLM